MQYNNIYSIYISFYIKQVTLSQLYFDLFVHSVKCPLTFSQFKLANVIVA